jgi:hypothetical protein
MCTVLPRDGSALVDCSLVYVKTSQPKGGAQATRTINVSGEWR